MPPPRKVKRKKSTIPIELPQVVTVPVNDDDFIIDPEPITTHHLNEVVEPVFNEEEIKNVAIVSEIVSDTTALQVDDFIIPDHNNNPLVDVQGNDNQENEIILIQETNINQSPCKNDDSAVVEGTTEILPFQESCENNTTLTVKDDSKENEDSEQNVDDDDDQGDDVNNEGGEDPSLLGNIKDQGVEIHVGKLGKDTVEDDLVKVFQQFGELKSARIVRKQNTNKSKGFAFIQFATVDQTKRALSEFKDGVEVRGKRATVSASQNNRTLYLGNIHKTWEKEQVMEQLKQYGIEDIETICIPEDSTIGGKIRGYAFLEFTSRSTAATAFQRLQKPDAIFGRDISAKVAYAQSGGEDLSHVNQVYLEGITKDWTEEKVKEIGKKYGEILRIKLCPSTKTTRKDFGFITFTSHESVLACVEGINNTDIGGEAKIKASIAKPPLKNRVKQQGFRGGFKVEKPSEASTSNKEGEVSNKSSEPKSSKMIGVLNTQQTQGNKKKSSKNKNKANTVKKPQEKGLLKRYAESSKKAALIRTKDDPSSQQAPKNKRKTSSDQKLNNRDYGTPKKPKRGGEGKNSKTAFKAGKRKTDSAYEAHEDRSHGKKPYKKQKGNMYGRERDNTRNPLNDTHIIRGHEDFRNSTRYAVPYVPKYAASASDAYHLAPDHPLTTRRYMEMEPHAGYIEPASASQSRSYSGYSQPVVRNPHSQQHQNAYLAPASTSQSHIYDQSQLYSRYLDRSALTQSHRGYDGSAVLSEIQPYRDYRQPAAVQIARDPYDSGLTRVVRHDDRVAGIVTYVGGPPLPASQVRDHTSYYQGAGSYSGAYTSRQTYY